MTAPPRSSSPSALLGYSNPSSGAGRSRRAVAVIIENVVLLISDNCRRFKVIDAAGKVRRFDTAPIRHILRHGKAQPFPKPCDKQLRKRFQGGSAFAEPPAAILDAPVLFVAADVGQFRGDGGKLGFLICPGVAGKAAGQGNFRKGVLCEPNLVIGERFFPSS